MEPANSLEQAIRLERQAQELRLSQKIEEAFKAYDEAGSLYAQTGEHLKAAFCFASASTCWNIRTGWQPLRQAAERAERAALEAFKAGSYHYARSLFLDAALLYEKEGDFGNYSACFYESKRSERKHAWGLFRSGRRREKNLGAGAAGWKERLLALGRWALNLINCAVWGYGERPFRTFLVGFALILFCGVIYFLSGPIQTLEGMRPISFLEGLYLSVITYTTVGFGDYLPLGWTRIFAMLEALFGIFLAPLFLIGLTRRYLRMYR